MKHPRHNGERVTKVPCNISLGGMNIRVRESLTSCVAFHFLRASCFHHIRSLTGIKGTEKSRVQESGAPVVVARHVNAGVYNKAVYICCASLTVAQGCPGTKSETHTAVHGRGGKSGRIQAECKRHV